MRWLYLTLGLFATCVCLVGWIYIRDRDTSWRPPEPETARVDAQATLAALRGYHCYSGCAARLLGRTRSHHWLVLVTLRGQPRCVQIDVDTFRMSERGLLGVAPSSCAVGGLGSASRR